MQIGNLPRASVKRRNNNVFQLVRVALVIGIASAGSFALSLTMDDTNASSEAVAAIDRQPDGTSAPRVADEPRQIPSQQVASAVPSMSDLTSPDVTFGSGIPSVAPDEPVQEASQGSMPADASGVQAAAAPVSPSVDTQVHETEQASTNQPTPSAEAERTGAVSVASVADNPSQDPGLADLNSASFEQLNSLRNAGPIGRAIIKGRPYASVEDLVKRKVVRRSVYEKIKDQVTVQ